MNKLIIFIKSSLLKLIIVTVIIGVITFLSFLNFAQVFENTAALQLVYDTPLINTDCIAVSNNINPYLLRDKEVLNVFYSDLIKIYKESDAVNNVYGFDVSYGYCDYSDIRVYTAYPETYKVISTELQSGSWFDEKDLSDDYPSAVVCGSLFKDKNVGDIIKLKSKDLNFFYDPYIIKLVDKDTIEVRIVGKVSFPYYAPNFRDHFSSSPPYLSSDSNDIVYLLHDDVTVSALKENNFNLSPDDTFVYVDYKTDNQKKLDEFYSYVSHLSVSEKKIPNIQPVREYMSEREEPIQPYFTSAVLSKEFGSTIVSVWIILIIAIFLILSHNSVYGSNRDGKISVKSSLSSIIGAILKVSTAASMLSCITALLYTSGKHFLITDFLTESAISEFLSSSYTFSIVLYYLVIWVLINIVPIFVAIFTFKNYKQPAKLIKNDPDSTVTEYYNEYDDEMIQQDSFEYDGAPDYHEMTGETELNSIISEIHDDDSERK